MSNLVVTLRRGLAGKKGTDLLTAAALGLRRTGQVVVVPNDSTSRGQVNKARRGGRVLPAAAAAAARRSPRGSSLAV